MPYKPPMPDEDIEALAAELRPLWRKGKAVRPWLRKHAPRLIELVRDEWTWACVGRALTQAGITYRTGRPWDGEHLRTQVARATAPLKGRQAAPVVIRPAQAKPLAPVIRPEPARQLAPPPQKLPDEEHQRLNAKYGFQALVDRRALELRGEKVLPWTQEELEEQRIYEADKKQFRRLTPASRMPPQDEYQREARKQLLWEESNRRFDATYRRR